MNANERAKVVGRPEVVAMRRKVQDAYARISELRKREHGEGGFAGGCSSETLRQTSDAKREAEAEHERLSLKYEAMVEELVREEASR